MLKSSLKVPINKFYTFVLMTITDKELTASNTTIFIFEAPDSEVAKSRLKKIVNNKGYYNQYKPSEVPTINSTPLEDCCIDDRTAFPNYSVAVYFDNNEVEYWFINENTRKLEKADSIKSVQELLHS